MPLQAQLTTSHATEGCSNAALLARMADGDQLAWKQLIDRYDGLIRSVAASFRLQATDMHDVAQTTWLRLFQHGHAVRDPERLGGWLRITATRVSLAILHQASRQELTSAVDETPDTSVGPEASAVDSAGAGALWAAVAELPPRQQRLLHALFREGLDSYDDIAAKCAMPIGSIGPTRARALSRLRRNLAERGVGPADI